jgi:hypothetical protein
LDDDAPQDESVSRLLFKWAKARIPAPDPNTPSGEKLSETLQQAGYIGGGKAHTFQVFRVLLAIGLAVLMGAFASIAGKRFGMVALMAITGILVCWRSGTRIRVGGAADRCTLGSKIPSSSGGRRATASA